MIGKVDYITFTWSGYQVTSIDGKKYQTWFDLHDLSIKQGVTVEYEPKGDEAKIVRVLDKPDANR